MILNRTITKLNQTTGWHVRLLQSKTLYYASQEFFSQKFGCINCVDMVIGHGKEWKADISSASPSSERIKELWGCMVLYVECWKQGNVKRNKTKQNKPKKKNKN